MVGKCFQELIECCPVPASRGEVPRQRQTSAPPLWISVDQPLAQLHEPLRGPHLSVGALQAIEREMSALRHGLDEPLPRIDRSGEIAVALARVAEVEVRRHGARIDVDGVGEGPCRNSAVAGALLPPRPFRSAESRESAGRPGAGRRQS